MKSQSQGMWNYQAHFRLMVEGALEGALEAVGAAPLQPVVVLVGVAGTSGPPGPAIIVEPQVDSVLTRLDHSLQHHDQALNTLNETLSSSTIYTGRTFVSAHTGMINGYDVYTCIGLDTATLEALDSLAGDLFQNRPIATNLPLEVVRQVLSAARALLNTENPGHGAWPPGLTHYEIIRRSARLVMESCALRAGARAGSALFDRLDTITSQHYEGAGASGRMVLARRGHPAVVESVSLKEPIPISYYRSLRKLLETTDAELTMLCDGESVFGLGSVANYDGRSQDLFEIDVAAHATWKLRHDTRPLMQVEYGKAALSKPAVSRAVFDNTMSQQFPTLTSAEMDHVWRLVRSAALANHGSTIVITANAKDEADRLAGQATLVDPVFVDTSLVGHITKIDGAVLMDHRGVCYAIGVILDGTASTSGDPSRGARFNSAIRYLETYDRPAVAVVVSSDGDVHVLPRAHDQIPVSVVRQAVDQLQSISEEEYDPAAFDMAWRELEAVAFYLTEEQCRAVNELTADYTQLQRIRGEQARSYPKLCVNPDMGPSYLVDDSPTL